jgi:3-keto-disaccharide hydrolase
MIRSAIAVISTGIVATNLWLSAQQAPTAQQQPPAGQQAAQGRRGGGRGPQPVPFEDRTGFKPIFDGNSLTNWDGDPAHWRAEGGAIVGETTAANPLSENTFIIYRGGEPADFELKVEFRINSTNSGVQYRSVHLPQGTTPPAPPNATNTPAPIAGKWVLKGYQADIDFENNFTGMLYEERGRGFLAPRGTVGYVGPVRGAIGSLESSDALKSFIKVNDWNQFHVIARGPTLVHILNGHATAVFIDDDTANRAMKGLLGFQLHQGPPMKVEFKNVLLKTL